MWCIQPIKGNVILNKMHIFVQTLNFEDQREFGNRETEHMNTPIYIVDAQKVDENQNIDVVEFIDKYITCALPDNTEYPEMRNLVKKVKTHVIQALVERKRLQKKMQCVDLMFLGHHQIKLKQFVLRRRLMKSQ